MFASKLLTVIAIGCCTLPASAVQAGGTVTPASGVQATNLAAGGSSGDIQIATRGPVEVTFREITIAPGGSTGWHHHAGELLAVVQAGTLTRQLEDCSVVVSPTGQAFVEPAGGQHVHVGRNLGTEPVVLHVAYVLPAGSPFSEESPDPGCGR